MLKFIDLNTQYQRLKQAIDARCAAVLEHGQYIKGPEVAELEQQLAAYVGVKHAIGVANGTDALQIALMALGVGVGDEVIVPDFTFIAPAEVAACLGARVVFADINPKTYNLNVNSVKQHISAKTKAIIPVSLFGQCADFEAINAVAAEHNIPVIEDAAQSFGATYRGNHSCNLTAIACTSFFPSKPLGCYGDGGACFTNDDELAEKITLLSNHGMAGRYNHVSVGLNSRLDTLQAAVLLEKLRVLPEELARRSQLAALYSELLADYVQVPYIEPHNSSAYAQYTIATPKRDQLQQYLQEREIPTAIHYQKALHQQVVFAELAATTDCPNSEHAANTVISLPFSPYLREEDLRRVAQEIISFFEDGK